MSQKPSAPAGPGQPKSDRPGRWSVTDDLSQTRTVAAQEADFQYRPGVGAVLALGTGPDPQLAARLIPKGLPVAYVERPGCAWSAPAGWTRIAPEDLNPQLLGQAHILAWMPGERLWPSFWGPIFARMRLARLGPRPARAALRLAWIGCGPNPLMVREIEDALTATGWRTRRPAWDADPLACVLLGLREEQPDMFLSLNFHGLDSQGQTARLLAESGCAMGVWLVDNPFHALSGIKSDWWRDVPLFVTDASFVEPLRQHGAKRVEHLPLAAWTGFAPQAGPDAGVQGRIVFVGRSEFPDKDTFFAASRVEPDLLTEAASLLPTGQRPDYFWWADRMGVNTFWPGYDSRRPGRGAQESGRSWRALCLESAARTGNLTVYGDDGWRDVLAGRAELRPPVDYYGPLAGIYAGAGCVLNVTGMLLPAGLTQRHFDVWTAGGCLISDANPGLDLFPADLTQEIAFRTPEEIPDLAARLGGSGNPRRRELIAAWRAVLLSGHTYAHRINRVLEVLGL